MSTTVLPGANRLLRVARGVAAAGVLGLALAAGTDVWLRAAHDGGRPAPAPGAVSVVPAVPAVPAAASLPLVVLVADSEDQAAFVRADLARVEAARSEAAPVTFVVLARDAPGADAALAALAQDAQLVRPDGQPAVTVIALGTPA